MSLAKITTDYLAAWEGHTEFHGIKLQHLVRTIVKCTVDEINTEYNALCRQNLWVTPLIDTFYDELLRRIMIDATFAISTAWINTSEWMQHPFVYIRIGFEDAYVITKSDGSLISADDRQINTFALVNDSFPENIANRILHLLINREIVATVQILGESISIIAIENKNDPVERIVFPGKDFEGQIVKVEARIHEIGDFNTIRRMLDGLRSQTFEIVDPYEKRLEDYEDFKPYSFQQSVLVRVDD